MDLRDVNRILAKVREHESKVKYEHIGDRDDLMIVGIGDASLKTGDKAVGGYAVPDKLYNDKTLTNLLEGQTNR